MVQFYSRKIILITLMQHSLAMRDIHLKDVQHLDVR